MEFNFMEAATALRSSLRRELAKTMSQQAFLDEFRSVNLFNSNVNGVEDFPVDCFLDFSQEEDNISEEEDKDSSQNDDNNSNSSCSVFSSESFHHTEFSEPIEELKELEWVSQFVDDSPLELTLLCPNPQFNKNRFEPEPEPVFPRGPCFALPSPVPVGTRTKRQKTTRRTWSFGLPSILTKPAMSSSSSSLTSITVQIERPVKKGKRKSPVQTGCSPVQRRCSHCQIQKTPQWRTGPHGAKTLCNACGVRFKSGRLFPEYRPACSPTFSGDVHSNSHRKVLEMRKKKESVEPESCLIQMVQSF
jgi:hypothetical protein